MEEWCLLRYLLREKLGSYVTSTAFKRGPASATLGGKENTAAAATQTISNVFISATKAGQ